MQRRLFLKLGVIAALVLLLLLPLALIEGQIAGRSARQLEVARNIAESAAGAQTIVGPVLSIRFHESVEHHTRDEKTGRDVTQTEVVEQSLVLPPAHLDLRGDARIEARSRGLYSARLFHLALSGAGKFVVSPHLGLAADRKILDAEATLVLGVSDPRGIDNDLEVLVNGTARRFLAGNAAEVPGQGIQTVLGPINWSTGEQFDFSFPLALTGSERLAIAPAGEETNVELKADWPHPSFQGRFLPISHSIGPDGFEAIWHVSHLAHSFEHVMKGTGAQGDGETLDVSFIEPVNIYLKAERAVKYGILFIALTFAVFFLTEVLRRLSIHPLQYLLVGLALAIFFLLLIALSEPLPFALAYALSAFACVALIGTYLSAVVKSAALGAAIAGGIACLYALLYAVLLSEDNALLMGALLLFAALCATMMATRRVDWYEAVDPEKAVAAESVS